MPHDDEGYQGDDDECAHETGNKGRGVGTLPCLPGHHILGEHHAVEQRGHGEGDDEREGYDQQIDASEEAVDVAALGSADFAYGYFLLARTGGEGYGAIDAHGADDEADDAEDPA